MPGRAFVDRLLPGHTFDAVYPAPAEGPSTGCEPGLQHRMLYPSSLIGNHRKTELAGYKTLRDTSALVWLFG